MHINNSEEFCFLLYKLSLEEVNPRSCPLQSQRPVLGHRGAPLKRSQYELDSYMYQTVGHQAIELYGEAMDLPLYRRTIQGSSLDTSRNYSETEGDEVEDLYELLRLVKEKEAVEAVSVGAILSDYQRVRVENVCLRLGLQPLAYLWRRDQESLLSEMISSDLRAILIKVAAFGLDPEKHLGKPLADMEPYLKQLSQKYGVHICGEGGEYETFTLDCPLFKKKIVIDAAETVIHSADAFAPVGYLRFTKMHAENKDSDAVAGALPHGSCPCQNAIDKMTEEVEYADQAEDNQQEFTSSCDLSCQQGHDVPPSCSARSSRGYQWISGINGLQSQVPGIQAQTSAAFAQLQSELDRRGWTLKDVILIHLYVSSMDDYGQLNAIYKQHFCMNPPARVCVQATLPAGQLLQIDCLLHDWTEPPQEGCFHQREAMHVQSLSHWAPANIGPYSQSVRVDESVFCAGQIALVPCTMQLMKAGARMQAHLSFSHMKKVLEAVISGLTLAHVVQAHCYTTRHQDIPVIRAVWESMLTAAEQEKDLLWEPEIGPAPLLVAVVPALPKGAAVELHVTAVQDDYTKRTSCHMTAGAARGSIECYTLMSADRCSASLSLSLAAPGGDDPEAKDATEKVAATFKRAMEEMDAELVPLCARVFYKCGHSLAKQIVGGLEGRLRSSLDESSPCVALVPVLDLPDSQILHLSCWLSL
ncbi:diphthine--ammonia ligase isoform X1 [Scophthalmus maximus]|uniref:diphthine--ammonia ligase isoform X1 n=2 Tax=Scophthalmus maximus TaxID=52904 RepID=UPI001FA86DF4|nr:diphthine--ammonia ligase isoform X1 [Scophthalmus maximus]